MSRFLLPFLAGFIALLIFSAPASAINATGGGYNTQIFWPGASAGIPSGDGYETRTSGTAFLAGYTSAIFESLREGFRETFAANIGFFEVVHNLGQVPADSYQINLTISGTSATVYIPGEGPVPASSLSSNEYENRSDDYMTSESGESLKGLVLQNKDAQKSVRAYKNNSNHTLSINMGNLTTGRVYLVFTKGSWEEVADKYPEVKSGDFSSSIKPSFGYGLGVVYAIKMLFNLSGNDIDVLGNLTFRKGTSKLQIDNTGDTSSGNLQLNFTRGT